jgi:hypothetical protein
VFKPDGMLDEQAWVALSNHGAPVPISYTITQDDLSELVAEVPEDYTQMAEMDQVGYVSIEEKLADRFHMDVDFLKGPPLPERQLASHLVTCGNCFRRVPGASILGTKVEDQELQMRSRQHCCR